MISLANQAAIESPFVTTVAIDATEFPDLVRRYKVNGVPKTIVNDTMEIMGAAPEDEFVAAITRPGIRYWDSGLGLSCSLCRWRCRRTHRHRSVIE